jgi:hypothetical protein
MRPAKNIEKALKVSALDFSKGLLNRQDRVEARHGEDATNLFAHRGDDHRFGSELAIGP